MLEPNLGQNPVLLDNSQQTRAALNIPRPIDVVQLQTTVSTAFTARDDADFQVESLIASNMTGSAATVTIYMVPDGGAAGAANTIVFQKQVPANDWITVFHRENQGLLQPGMTLEALCSVNDAVNLFGYGFDYQGVYS